MPPARTRVDTDFPSENAINAKMPERFLFPVIVKPLWCPESKLREFTSAKHQVCGQPGFARFLVFCVHVPTGIGQGLDRGVEIDAVP